MSAAAAFSLPDIESGTIWLVGAGPGDPGLLSLLAARALRQAEVILYDPGIPEALRRLFGPEARAEAAPQRNSGTGPAASLGARAVELARAGWRVARLVEGDPLSTAHGVLEAQEIIEAKIPLRIVPGIGAALAGASYGGIPATHRDVNSIFATLDLTGTGASPATAEIASLAKAIPVFFLTLLTDQVAGVAKTLTAAGKAPATPVALITDPGTPQQFLRETTLGDSALAAEVFPASERIAMIVGPVVTLRRQLAWQGKPAVPAAAPRYEDHPLDFSMSGIAG